MHILHTVLCTHPTVLTKRICLTIKSFSGWSSFPLFLRPYDVIEGGFYRENLVASHSTAEIATMEVNALQSSL